MQGPFGLQRLMSNYRQLVHGNITNLLTRLVDSYALIEGEAGIQVLHHYHPFIPHPFKFPHWFHTIFI
ncbi:hypothetical protein L1887_34860 [Cichorium endivia]|nr:hypothetical protein L1887_34860 [Cichorium endivia]